ncbi:MAG: Cys-tRNA(Pro) deacylase [Eubacterium sp.]|nr:Cys-tRNA(Pro) deacylase [Clostridiales bacterium]MDY3774773.1 Cys-tRNA(Pro) deacylase [Eubacterium sp.]
MKKEEKTNVMRVLEAKKVPYQSHNYLDSGAISGTEVAKALGQNPDAVFKTLVTVSKSKKYYVFLVPVEKELDLKKAASCVGEKKIEMLKAKELLPLTGYIHGGCSPIGMKKFFPTFIDASAAKQDTIFFSGGKIGFQVQLSLADLKKVIRFELADIVE